MKTALAIFLACGGVATLYAAGEQFGFRPAYLAEVRDVRADLDQVAVNVDWVRLENYERLLARGVKLSQRDCAEYLKLARRLGVTARAC